MISSGTPLGNPSIAACFFDVEMSFPSFLSSETPVTIVGGGVDMTEGDEGGEGKVGGGTPALDNLVGGGGVEKTGLV